MASLLGELWQELSGSSLALALGRGEYQQILATFRKRTSRHIKQIELVLILGVIFSMPSSRLTITEPGCRAEFSRARIL